MLLQSTYNNQEDGDLDICTNVTLSKQRQLSIAELQTRDQRYLNAATSDNTRKAYRSAVCHFERWGGRLPTDKDTIIMYLLEHAEKLNSRTLAARLTALSQWHKAQNFVDPCQDPAVRKRLKGIKREHGQRKNKAKALRLKHLMAMLNHLNRLPMSNKKIRDLALIQIGFFGAFRRSELVSIEVENLVWEPEGLIINMPRSKTDQDGEGIERIIPKGNSTICPVSALREWVDLENITTGPVFRPINRWDQVNDKALAPGSINHLLKSLGQKCGFDFVQNLSSHSFRRGLTTSAAREDVDFKTIKKQGSWKSNETVWEYIDEGRQFKDNAALALFDKIESMANVL